MKNDFFYEQTFYCGQIDNGINQTKQILSEILEQWKQRTSQPLTIDMVDSFLDKNRNPIRQNVETELMKPILQKSPLFGEIADDKLKEMLSDKIPDMSLILEKLNRFSEYIEFANFQDRLNLQCFLIKGDEITILDQEVDKLKSNYRFKAENPIEKERLEQVKKLCVLIESITRLAPDENKDRFTIRGLTEFDSVKQVFVPDPFFIKNGYLVSPIIVRQRTQTDNLQSSQKNDTNYSSNPGTDALTNIQRIAEKRNAHSQLK